MPAGQQPFLQRVWQILNLVALIYAVIIAILNLVALIYAVIIAAIEVITVIYIQLFGLDISIDAILGVFSFSALRNVIYIPGVADWLKRTFEAQPRPFFTASHRGNASMNAGMNAGNDTSAGINRSAEDAYGPMCTRMPRCATALAASNGFSGT
jgi:hypothetical protein